MSNCSCPSRQGSWPDLPVFVHARLSRLHHFQVRQKDIVKRRSGLFFGEHHYTGHLNSSNLHIRAQLSDRLAGSTRMKSKLTCSVDRVPLLMPEHTSSRWPLRSKPAYSHLHSFRLIIVVTYFSFMKNGFVSIAPQKRFLNTSRR